MQYILYSKASNLRKETFILFDETSKNRSPYFNDMNTIIKAAHYDMLWIDEECSLEDYLNSGYEIILSDETITGDFIRNELPELLI